MKLCFIFVLSSFLHSPTSPHSYTSNCHTDSYNIHHSSESTIVGGVDALLPKISLFAHAQIVLF